MAADYKVLKNGDFMRQVQKDNFSPRLRVMGGSLMVEQLLAVVEINREHGDGHVHLIPRQGVEIPFTKLGDMESVRVEPEEGGVDTGVYEPRVRTVTAYQGSAICPPGCTDTYTPATEVFDRYSGRELSHRLKFRVTGCQNNRLKVGESDVGIKGSYTVERIPGVYILYGVYLKACREGALTRANDKTVLEESKYTNRDCYFKTCLFDVWKGEPGYLVSLGGAFGNLIAKGRRVPPVIRDKETLSRVADAAMAFFDRHVRPSERFRVAIDRVSWDEFEIEMEMVYRG